MIDIVERKRLASPAPKPQSLAFDGAMLWMGSRETRHLYAIDPVEWTSADLGEAPGTPWGIAVTGQELKIVSGEKPDDNRFIRRYSFEHGFDPAFRWPCPDDTGSQLSYDGRRLYLSQWYNKRIVVLDDDGKPERTIDLSHEICGQVFVRGDIYCVTTDHDGTYFWTNDRENDQIVAFDVPGLVTRT
jgi:hypothetical protein